MQTHEWRPYRSGLGLQLPLVTDSFGGQEVGSVMKILLLPDTRANIKEIIDIWLQFF